MKLKHLTYSLIFFLSLGFFVSIPLNKAYAVDVPETPPAFPTAISTAYDDLNNVTMSGHALVYGGNTTKYWFAYTFNTDSTLAIPFAQGRTNNSDTGFFTQKGSQNENILKSFISYVYKDGSWVYLMDRNVTVSGQFSADDTVLSAVKSVMGCNSGSYMVHVCVSNDYAFSDAVISSQEIYWYNNFNPDFPTAHESYGAKSVGDPLGAGDLTSIPAGQSEYVNTSPYYIKYGLKAIESNEPCVLDISANPSNTTQWFSCPNDDFFLFEVNPTNGTKTPLYDFPILDTPDAPANYCTNIKESNYILYDDEGNQLCGVLAPSYLRGLISNYEDPIDRTAIENEDWGIGSWFKTPFLWFVDIVNNVAKWGYDIYYKFLTFIVPDPDMFAYYFTTIKTALTNKFQSVDLSSLEAFGDIQPSNLPNITTRLMGVDVVLLDFTYLKNNINIIQPIAIAAVGLFLLFFHINQVNKLLTDTEVTA